MSSKKKSNKLNNMNEDVPVLPEGALPVGPLYAPFTKSFLVVTNGDIILNKGSGNKFRVVDVNKDMDFFIARRESDGKEIEFTLSTAHGHFEHVYELDMDYGMSDFLNDNKLKTKCECGVDTLGYGNHSGYCPKSGRNDVQ